MPANTLGAQLLEHLQPVHHRHIPVHQRQVEGRARFQLIHAGLAISGFLALDSLLFEQAAQISPHEAGIIDNQSSHGHLLTETALTLSGPGRAQAHGVQLLGVQHDQQAVLELVSAGKQRSPALVQN